MLAKKILINLLAVCLAEVSAASLAAEIKPSSSAAPSSNIYTEAKQNFLVTSDQPVFTLQLKSNPTTGYSWFLREYDPELIQPIKHSFQKSDKKLMGAPGYEIWTFKVKPAGFVVPQQTTIRLIYSRPWEGADSSTQIVFRVTTTSK